MRRGRVLAGSLLLASTVTACGLILGIGDEQFTAEDAGTGDVVAPPPQDTRLGCDASNARSRPSKPDRGGQMVVFAFTAAAMGADPDGGPTKGYDLDGVCTCDPNERRDDGGSSCRLPPNSPGVCDDDGGIDDEVGRLLDSVGYLNPQAVLETFNTQLHCGHVGVLVVLTGYSGEPDDPEVGVTFLPSPGVQAPHADDAGELFDVDCIGADGGIPFYVPRGNATDLWSVLEGGIDQTGGPDPLNIAPGWVNDYELVVDGRDAGDGGAVLRFPIGGVPLVVHAPIMTARIVGVLSDGGVTEAGAPEAVGFAIRDGIASGRVASNDFIESLATVPIRSSGAGNFMFLCDHQDRIDFVKTQLCPNRDVVTAANSDGKDQPCDAVSLVVRFSAAPASIGDAGVVTTDAACSTPIDASCEGF